MIWTISHGAKNRIKIIYFQPQAVPISQGYPPGYIAYPEGVPPSGIFMPFWVLPNKRFVLKILFELN